MTVCKIARLNAADKNFKAQLNQLSWQENDDLNTHQCVVDIINQVKKKGDEALLAYTNQFDHTHFKQASEIIVSPFTLKQAWHSLATEQAQALQTATARITTYAQAQKTRDWQYSEADGTVLGQKITPLDKVGIYVPGGKASYPSSVLMNAIPAKVAGVKEIIMVVPTPKAQSNQLVLAAAYLAGVDKVFTIGGAQAIAALSFGTQTVPSVDKIVGPGNIYVSTAKKIVFGKVGIDMIAGPSEILIIGDGKTPACWIAMDLFAQAEHDENAQAILISDNADYLNAVEQSIQQLLPTMERQDIIRTSLNNRGALIKADSLIQAAQIANSIAPEHLELSVADPISLNQHIKHAGAIFMGSYSAEVLGDYCAGPNHVLPTSGTARYSSPLGVYDFQKRSSIIHCSKSGANTLAKTASILAKGEGLIAHARSAEYRINSSDFKQTTHQLINTVFRQQIIAQSAYQVADTSNITPRLIKLDAMENPYPCPDDIKTNWLQLLKKCSLNRYPDPSAKTLIATIRKNQQIPAQSEILLGNGSDEIIQLLLVALPNQASILAPSPSFTMYQQIASSLGIKYHSVPLLASGFELDLTAMLKTIAQTKPALIFIAYPNNPTANLFSASAITAIINATTGLVIIDEAYAPFSNISFINKLSEHTNLLVMRTVSKWGLAGIRLGFIAGNKAIIEQLNKIRLPYNINSLTQISAEFALKNQPIFTQQTQQICQNRTQLLTELKQLPTLTVYPSVTNFILFKTSKNQATFIFEALKKQGILIKNLSPQGGVLTDCLRVTIGNSAENKAFMSALRRVIDTTISL